MSVARRLFLFLLISLVPACRLNAQGLFSEEPRLKTALREAVFRYMFQNYKYGTDVKLYCIAAERPLPDNFMRRFDDVSPRVVWSFECDHSGPMNAIMHKKSREHGLLMTIKELNWKGGRDAQAKVEAFSDGIAANWNTLELTLKEDHWIVKSDELTGVS